ncbi:MAG: hypothetical protein IT223_11505 [Crocinitomicaceae bacterium]|nr:hypothetical protein [Crocinitomicaceae bacterium]
MITSLFSNCLSLFLLMGISISAIAQIQVDRRIELTGTGSDARITGIEEINTGSDAVNAAAIQNNELIYSDATLNGSTYEINISPAPSALQSGQVFHFRAGAVNTGATLLKVNALTAYPIAKNFNQPLSANDIQQGQMVSVIFDGANNYFQMLSQMGQTSSGLSSAQVFSPVTCVSGKTSVTWADFYPSAQAAGYDLNKCLPRSLSGQSNEFGWLFLAVSSSGCSGGSLNGTYTPSASATWNNTVATTGSSSYWFIIYNRTVDIICFK